MKILSTKVTKVTFSDVEDLDPISVIIEDFAPGSARITIISADSAWTRHWPAIGNCDGREFFCGASNEYLIKKLTRPETGDRNDPIFARIVTTVKAGLEAMKALEIATNPLPDDTAPSLLSPSRRSSPIEADEL